MHAPLISYGLTSPKHNQKAEKGSTVCDGGGKLWRIHDVVTTPSSVSQILSLGEHRQERERGLIELTFGVYTA
jgi:hypothetical protein